MRFNFFLSAVLSAIVINWAVPVFCADSKPVIVARVNDEVITLDELEQAVDSYNRLLKTDFSFFDNDNTVMLLLTGGDLLRYSSKIVTPQQKMSFLREMVQMRLLYQEALRRGLDKVIHDGKVVSHSPIFSGIFLQGVKNELVKRLVDQEINDVSFAPAEIDYLYRLFNLNLGVRSRGVRFTRVDTSYADVIVFAKKRLRINSLYRKLMKDNEVVVYGEVLAAKTVAPGFVGNNGK